MTGESFGPRLPVLTRCHAARGRRRVRPTAVGGALRRQPTRRRLPLPATLARRHPRDEGFRDSAHHCAGRAHSHGHPHEMRRGFLPGRSGSRRIIHEHTSSICETINLKMQYKQFSLPIGDRRSANPDGDCEFLRGLAVACCRLPKPQTDAKRHRGLPDDEQQRSSTSCAGPRKATGRPARRPRT